MGELCDDLLGHIQNNSTEYKDQKNPPHRIGLIKNEFGDRIASTVRPPEITKWLDSVRSSRTGEPLAPASRNRLKVTLSSIYRYGKEQDKVNVNPARDVKSKRVSNSIIRFLRQEEEERIRKTLQDDIDLCPEDNVQMRKRLIHRIHEFTISLGTGMRESEQYGLTRTDLDMDVRRITVRDTKNGETRYIPMNDDVYASFQWLLDAQLSRKDRATDRPNPSPKDSVFGIGDNKSGGCPL